MSAPPPIPSVTGGASGPSTAADTGNARDVGTMTVGDYYATGSRVRQSQDGWGWQELAALGVVGIVGLVLWRKL